MNIVLLGHLESGKSTVTGHLLCKLGALDKKAIERCEREASEANLKSSRYAWVSNCNKRNGRTLTGNICMVTQNSVISTCRSVATTHYINCYQIIHSSGP